MPPFTHHLLTGDKLGDEDSDGSTPKNAVDPEDPGLQNDVGLLGVSVASGFLREGAANPSPNLPLLSGLRTGRQPTVTMTYEDIKRHDDDC